MALVSVLWHPSARMEMSRVRKKVFTAFSPFVLLFNMRSMNLFVKGEGGQSANNKGAPWGSAFRPHCRSAGKRATTVGGLAGRLNDEFIPLEPEGSRPVAVLRSLGSLHPGEDDVPVAHVDDDFLAAHLVSRLDDLSVVAEIARPAAPCRHEKGCQKQDIDRAPEPLTSLESVHRHNLSLPGGYLRLAFFSFRRSVAIFRISVISETILLQPYHKA